MIGFDYTLGWFMMVFVSSSSMLLGPALGWAGGCWELCLNFFIAHVWMIMAMFSLTACGFFFVFMRVLISSSVRPMSLCSWFGVGGGCGAAQFLSLSQGLFWFRLVLVSMGFMPRQFLLALHSLWLLGCSPLQLMQLSFSVAGCSSVLCSLNAHVRHLSCLQLVVQWENILHLLHWKTCTHSS